MFCILALRWKAGRILARTDTIVIGSPRPIAGHSHSRLPSYRSTFCHALWQKDEIDDTGSIRPQLDHTGKPPGFGVPEAIGVAILVIVIAPIFYALLKSQFPYLF